MTDWDRVMGESRALLAAEVENVSRRLVDEGLLIEAGWISFDSLVLPQDAGPIQRQETRNAFFAGAQHLFASIMTIMDAGEEQSEADMRRMDQINAELERFGEELKGRIR